MYEGRLICPMFIACNHDTCVHHSPHTRGRDCKYYYKLDEFCVSDPCLDMDSKICTEIGGEDEEEGINQVLE